MPAFESVPLENQTKTINDVEPEKQAGNGTFQFVDNRYEATAQRQIQKKADNSPQSKKTAKLQAKANRFSNANPQVFQQQESKSTQSNGIIQMTRGFSKYGASMQGDPDPNIAVASPRNQGPHTVAHAAIAAVEQFIDATSTVVFNEITDNVDKYDLFVKHGIILKPRVFERKRLEELAEAKANKGAYPGIAADANKAIASDASLDLRSASYSATYRNVYDNCLDWYKKAARYKKTIGKRRNDGKPVTDHQAESYIMYNHELGLALNDIRDLNPASTYADKQVGGYTDDQIGGKGEPAIEAYIATIKGVIAQQKGGHFPTTADFVTALRTVIMHKADIEDLLPAEQVRVTVLANSYAKILEDLNTQGKF